MTGIDAAIGDEGGIGVGADMSVGTGTGLLIGAPGSSPESTPSSSHPPQSESDDSK